MQPRDRILDWLAHNKETINTIGVVVKQEAENALKKDPEFLDEIVAQHKEIVKTIVGIEISRQLGIQIDIIFEVLETPEVQEYLIQ